MAGPPQCGNVASIKYIGAPGDGEFLHKAPRVAERLAPARFGRGAQPIEVRGPYHRCIRAAETYGTSVSSENGGGSFRVQFALRRSAATRKPRGLKRSIEDRYVKRRVRGGAGYIDDGARARPSAELRRRRRAGRAGVRHFIAAGWQRRAGWERPAAQPLTHRRRLASQCYL
ncbi:unnamed protein product, partial [Iphiclides podalirius]